ncbi:YdcF family protein [Hymenobacter sp. NBH84]|uniref:YdcF family protein n=1 Tax=Hymenobacter sp. NBH84 TaxID=2596915 RepID=UPI00162AB924|nr:YdcF family protein [Hymenobacter sp. NBH84]QNE39061.1 YdcF family protein [Hymenobacter sp. NBH84]
MRTCFFLLSKILFYAIMPAVWLLALLLGAVVVRRPRWSRRLLVACAVLFVVLTNGALLNEALLAWELPPVRPTQLPTRSDAGVLLTGITKGSKSPHDRVYLSTGADRLTNALWLYRAGRIRRIIVSGGSGEVGGSKTGRSEAAQLATLLRLSGVPPQDILLEERSRNTRENALYTRQLLAQHPEIKSLVLVTSAFHQRRALGCFRQVGLHPIPFPAGYYSANRQATLAYWLLPDAGALANWSILLHELVGYVVYKVLGYC